MNIENPGLSAAFKWCIAVNVISGSVGLIVGGVVLRRTIKSAPYKTIICMVVLLMLASAFQLEYGFESWYYLNHLQNDTLLPMAHLMNYVVSQLAGLMNILCDLTMASKYLDTAVKLYTKQYGKRIQYGFGVFCAIIFLIALISISILLSKLGSESTLLTVYCDQDLFNVTRNSSILAVVLVSLTGIVIFVSTTVSLVAIRRHIISNRTKFGY